MLQVCTAASGLLKSSDSLRWLVHLQGIGVVEMIRKGRVSGYPKEIPSPQAAFTAELFRLAA